jgi:peptidoglycan/xylan/chitin deacetylase (PgdA/CDA1 family)
MINLLQKDQELWDIFTRKEEYVSNDRDKHERFPYYASSYRNIFEPHVSKYLIEHDYHVEYPEGKPFAIVLTHDIDQVYTSLSHKTFCALQNVQIGSLSGLTESIAQMRSRKLPLWNFNEILALEEHYDAKSSFYFMAENRGEQDYSYQIEDCTQALGTIIDHGCEVGLHGGYNTCYNTDELKGKKAQLEKVLNKKVIGYRNHYLRFNVPETWENLHESGFLYDSTFGYADCIGFRNGMCHPFKPYNLHTEKSIEMLEIPLTIMDDTLFNYMKLDDKRAWEMTKRLIDTVKQYNGVLTLLWHNYNFFKEKVSFYKKILHYCEEQNAWMTSGEQISIWWKNNVDTR